MGPFKSEKNVPRGTFLYSLAERYFCLIVKPDQPADLTLLPTTETSIAVAAASQLSDDSGRASFEVYVGPRDYFKLKELELETVFPIGTLGQIGLIMLWVLSAIAKLTHNYGAAIVIFSFLITCAMAPFTLLSFRSMKKMQELKPEIDRLMAHHKSDPQRANREIFALYKSHRVSPMSGCLPMLLQIPIFIALFQAISHFSALRGEQFLWIRDLSLPDHLWQFPTELPFLGSHLNLLPLIMAGAMYIQSRMSQARSGQSQQDPMAKMFSGPIMPIMFGVMFYQVPAGLVLYWLTNTTVSLVWYKLAK